MKKVSLALAAVLTLAGIAGGCATKEPEKPAPDRPQGLIRRLIRRQDKGRAGLSGAAFIIEYYCQTLSHVRVVRTAGALRHPVDVLVGILDVAGLAVDAVLRVDHIAAGSAAAPSLSTHS
jgi:hypothetical protein